MHVSMYIIMYVYVLKAIALHGRMLYTDIVSIRSKLSTDVATHTLLIKLKRITFV